MIALNTKSEVIRQTPADEIIERTLRIFGKERGEFWLKRPIQDFGGKSPKAMLRTKAGREEITAILDRVAYGIY